MKRTGAVLVAAGLSSPMEEFDPMLPFGSSTISRHLVAMLQEVGTDPIVVVTGYRSEELRQHLFFTGVRFVKNERFQKAKMLDSVKIGIQSIVKECERILILPMNFPAVLPDTLRRQLTVDAPAVQTMCRGTPGLPVMLWRETAEKICGYNKAGGLREAFEYLGIAVTDVEVDDEGIYRSFDCQEQYQELLDWNYRRGQGYPVRPQIKLWLTAGEPFYGPGIQQLLGWISRSSSLQEACLHMNISYSKGRKMVKRLEQQLGFPVVLRRAGGSGGGTAALTPEGERMRKAYEKMAADIQDFAEQTYEKYMGKGFGGGEE